MATVENILKALAHYRDFHKDFSEKNCCKNPYIKLLKKSLQLWKKVLVCMDDIAVSVVVCEGLKDDREKFNLWISIEDNPISNFHIV